MGSAPPPLRRRTMVGARLRIATWNGVQAIDKKIRKSVNSRLLCRRRCVILLVRRDSRLGIPAGSLAQNAPPRWARRPLDRGLGERYVDGDSTAGAGPAVHPALLWHRVLLALNCTLNSISVLAVICAGRSNAEAEAETNREQRFDPHWTSRKPCYRSLIPNI
jgi:hypothetical protein